MKITNDFKVIQTFANENDSIITAKRGVCRDLDGNEPVVKSHCGNVHDPIFLVDITSAPGQERHLDIVPGKFTLEYDLGDTPIEVDRMLMIGFSDGGPNDYSLHEFDLYFSTDGDTFNEKNHYYHYACETEFKPGHERTTHDVMIAFDKPVKATSFGFKVNEFCPADDCARLGFIGLYSEEYSRINSLLYNRYQYNTVSADDIKISSILEGEVSSLVDNKAFDKNFVALKDANVLVERKNAAATEVLYVAYEGGKNSISVDGKLAKTENIFGSYYIAEFKLGDTSDVTFSVNGDAKLYEVGLYDTVRKITITNEVINDNFYGVGVDCLPMAMMEESMAQGYTYTHWEEERRRIKLVRPAVARVWFQPDWFITDEETYYNLEFDYSTSKMKSFFAYLDAFKEAGTDIELNYGWKNAPHIQSWYEIPGIRQPGWSAPKDLDQHGKACAKFVDDLINKMGYSNVKYLTFYNEVCHDSDYGDFQTAPPSGRDLSRGVSVLEGKIDFHQFNYWVEMVEKVKKAFDERGISGIVEFWGPEGAGRYRETAWAEELEKNHSSLVDLETIHEYELSPVDMESVCLPMQKVCNGKPFALTEFSVHPAGKSWERSVIAMIMMAANYKVSAMLLWMISSVIKTVPEVFKVTGPGGDMWDIINKEPAQVSSFFYDVCLFMRYIPTHSKVLKTVVPEVSGKKVLPNWEGELVEYTDTDIRVASFITSDNNYVIAVEAKALDCERTIDIKLPDGKKRTFNKFSVGLNYDLDAPPQIPACEKQIEAEGNLVDNIGGDYHLIIYTTAKPYEQIICDKGYVELKKGETFDITYKLYDTDAKNVDFSIADGEDIVELDGNKIIAKAAGLAAVKVLLSDSEEKAYDIVLVKVI